MTDDLQIRIKELQQARAVEHFKSVISMAELSLKSSILINGAAAIALLTFVGNGKGAIKEYIVFGIFVFGLGALLGGLATLFAYLTQNNYMNQINNKQEINNEGGHKALAIFTCLASYVCFFVGTILSGVGILG